MYHTALKANWPIVRVHISKLVGRLLVEWPKIILAVFAQKGPKRGRTSEKFASLSLFSLILSRFKKYFDFPSPIKSQINYFLKGSQAWNNFEFFLPKSNPYMPLVNFWTKFRFFSFDFRQNFEVGTFSRWLNRAYAEPFFWRDIQKKFFPESLLLVGFLNGFSKFRFFII